MFGINENYPLQEDSIHYCTVSFEYYEYSQPYYDECGSSVNHASELDPIIQSIISMMFINQDNTVQPSTIYSLDICNYLI